MKAPLVPELSPSLRHCERNLSLIKYSAIEAFGFWSDVNWPEQRTHLRRWKKGYRMKRDRRPRVILDFVVWSSNAEISQSINYRAHVAVHYIGCILLVLIRLINSWQKFTKYLHRSNNKLIFLRAHDKPAYYYEWLFRKAIIYFVYL